MKKLILPIFILMGSLAFSQVGINQTDPKATLEITKEDNYQTETPAGIIVPKLTADELKTMTETNSKFSDVASRKKQEATLVYVTKTLRTPLSEDDRNGTHFLKYVTGPGFYYFYNESDNEYYWVRINENRRKTIEYIWDGAKPNNTIDLTQSKTLKDIYFINAGANYTVKMPSVAGRVAEELTFYVWGGINGATTITFEGTKEQRNQINPADPAPGEIKYTPSSNQIGTATSTKMVLSIPKNDKKYNRKKLTFLCDGSSWSFNTPGDN